MIRASSRRLAAALGSEQPVAHWSHKVKRVREATKFYDHPQYVMAREKLLNKMWREHLVFKASVYTVVPFFFVATLFKA
jgi:hypothetical protein